jgi:two-component system, response regulator
VHIPVHILITEDNPDDCELMRQAFKKAALPASLDFLHNGEEVIQFLQKLPPFDSRKPQSTPDLLLLDLKMPGLDGFGVLAWLREHPPFDRLTVVVFSGSDQPVDINQALKMGAARYLVKPHKLQDMIQMVSGIYRFCLKVQSEETHA